MCKQAMGNQAATTAYHTSPLVVLRRLTVGLFVSFILIIPHSERTDEFKFDQAFCHLVELLSEKANSRNET
jgi:hypothetical protein